MIARKVKKQDFKGICNLEFQKYKVMYAQQPYKKLRYIEMLQIRMQVASNWMWVLQEDSNILGCLTVQPTNKSPNDFKSWQESTDNGTLRKTFQPDGKYLYIVNFDAMEEATKKSAHLMLLQAFFRQIETTNIQLGYCEGRVPYFREWVQRNIGLEGWKQFSQKKQIKILQEYVNTITQRDGREVYLDKLINFFMKLGGKIGKIVLNAFDDPQSLNSGVIVCFDRTTITSMRTRRIQEQSRNTSIYSQLINGKNKAEQKVVGHYAKL